MKAAGYSLQS